MRRIAHLSDLHFGTVRDGLAEALLDRLAALRPDFVAVSGDLTQRARRHQYRAARAFLDRLPAPWLAVPGNHDVPLENLFVRFVRPFARYREHISRDLEPVHADEEVNVVGVNTVNPYAWQSGKFSRHATARVCRAFDEGGDGALRIVVLHHPLTESPNSEKKPTDGAPEAVAALAECGADLVLSGHLHSWNAAPFTASEGGRETLFVQAGTALSHRLRGEENDFNLITVDGPEVRIDRHTAGEAGAFVDHSTYTFRREGLVWR